MRWLVLQPGDASCNPVCLCNQVVAVLEQLRFAAVSALEHLLALNVLCNCVLSTRTHRVHVFIEALLQGRDGAALVKSHEVGEFFSLDLGKDLLLNSAEKQASPAPTAFAPPPWAVSKGFAHPTQTQLVLLDLAVT